MSALSLAVGLVFFHILCWRRIRFSPITAVAIVLFLVVSPLVPSNMVGVGDYTKRTSCRHLAEVFESPDGLSSLFGVCNTVTGAEEEEEEEEEEYVTPQASTIQTRLVLWQGSLHMLQAYPMTGVGLGEWNFAKSQYNIEWKTLLDSHNDYLHFLAELGVPLGVLFAVALYFLPWLRAEMLRRQGIDTLFDVLPILTVPMVMSMSAFSNSNGHKHQIFMILIILGWVAWVREGAATSNSSIDRAIPTVTG